MNTDQWMNLSDSQAAEMRKQQEDFLWKENAIAAMSVLEMVRAMIGEMFGTVASIESGDAVLRRGPEPKHTGEVILEALNRIHDAIIVARSANRHLIEALEKIAEVPAWGAPDRWETTPAEVRQLARSILSHSYKKGE